MISDDLITKKDGRKSSILFIDGSFLEEFIREERDAIKLLINNLNEKRFRVASTGLTYRQINSLGSNDLLDDQRKNNKNWRNFSFKELIYLSLTKELRKYGVIDKNLKKLKTIFFSKKFSFDIHNTLTCAMFGEQIIAVVDNGFNVCFYSAAQFLKFKGRTKSFISINLNEIFGEVLDRLGEYNIQYRTEYEKKAKQVIIDAEKKGIYLSNKEKTILNLIRDDLYKTITVRKSNNQSFIIKGEKIKEINEEELIGLIKSKDFADITIIKRDGNISNVKVEDSFKI